MAFIDRSIYGTLDDDGTLNDDGRRGRCFSGPFMYVHFLADKDSFGNRSIHDDDNDDTTTEMALDACMYVPFLANNKTCLETGEFTTTTTTTTILQLCY
jgi:hypothetical protein